MNAVLENVGGEITHHFSDGLYAKEAFVPEGTAILKHTHDFSHLSILAKGKVAVMTGEKVDIILTSFKLIAGKSNLISFSI